MVLAEETARGFVQATPAARRQIIEDLLGFGEFELYLKELRIRLKAAKQKIAAIDMDTHALQALSSAAAESIKSLYRRLSDADARIAACRKEMERLEAETGANQDPGAQAAEEALLEEMGALGETQRLADMTSEWRESKNELESEERGFIMDLQELTMKKKSLGQKQAMLLEQQDTVAHIAHGNQQLKKVQDGLDKHQQNVPSVLEELGAELLRGVVPPVGKPMVPPMLAKASAALLEDVSEVGAELQELQSILEEPFQNKIQLQKKSVVSIQAELEKVENALSGAKHALTQHSRKAERLQADWKAKAGPEDWQAIQAMLSKGLPNRQGLHARMQAAAAKREELLSRQSSAEDPRLSHVRLELARADELKQGLDSLLENEERQQAERDSKMAVFEKERLALVGKERILSFWDEGFGRKGKSMRDYVFEENLFELNAVLEEVMERLCDDGVDYHDLQTSLSKDFAFSGKDYGKRSSGERKRTALALFFSLVQLTRSRSRHQTEFIMLDECFDALDASGQDSAHRIIVEMHRGLGDSAGVRKAFVITHSQNANIGHLLRVEKTAGGTQFFPEPNSIL